MNNSESETLNSLSDLKFRESAVICGITANCDNNIRQRLLDLGFIKGATVSVRNISPMGNPVAYYIHETLIALRNEDAKCVQIIKGRKLEDVERRL
jgi:ferrous iron transport protein A